MYVQIKLSYIMYDPLPIAKQNLPKQIKVNFEYKQPTRQPANIGLLQRQKEANPNNMTILSRLGVAYFYANERQKAKNCLLRVVNFGYLSSQVLNVLATLNETEGRHMQALQYYKKWVSIEPRNVEIYKKMGKIYTSLKQIISAMQCYQKAYEIKKNDIQVLNRLGNIYYEMRKYQQALKLYRGIEEMNQKKGTNEQKIANCYLNLQRYKDAICYYEKALIYQRSSDLLNNLGCCYFETNEVEKSIIYFGKSLELDRKNKLAFNSLGNALSVLNRFQEAICNYRKALQIDPNYPHALNNLGNSLTKIGNIEQAIYHLEKAVKIEPRCSLYQNTLGVAYLRSGQRDKAKISFDTAISLDSFYSDSYYNKGTIFQYEEKYDEALKLYQQAIKFKKCSQYYNGMGNVLRQLKKQNQAIVNYKKAIDMNPKDPFPYNGLGVIYLQLNRFKEAQLQLKKALQIKKDYMLCLANYGNACIKAYNIPEARDAFQRLKLQLKQKQNQSQLHNQNIQHIKNSIESFQKVQKRIIVLKEVNKQNKERLRVIQKQEVKLYEPIYSVFKPGIKQSIICKKQDKEDKSLLLKEQKEKIEVNDIIMQRLLALQEKLVKVQSQNFQLKEKIVNLQQAALTVERISILQSQIQKLGIHNQQINSQIKKFTQLFEPEQKLQSQISQLKEFQYKKFAQYLQTLYWMLNSYVSAYRMMALNLVKKGQIVQTKVNSVIKKVSVCLGITRRFPVVGRTMSVIHDIVLLVLDKSQDAVVKEITSKFSSHWNDRRVSNAISECLLTISHSLMYRDMIENQTNIRLNSLFDNFCEMVNMKQQKIARKLNGLGQKQSRWEEQVAMIDCCYIISTLAKTESKGQDCLEQVIQILVNKRVQQQIELRISQEISDTKQIKKKKCNIM